MTVRFLVVGSQRSGTTVTQAVLRGHAEVSIPMEETRPDLLTDGYRACTYGLETYASRCRMNGRLFDALAGCLADERTRAMGLKVALGRAVKTA